MSPASPAFRELPRLLLASVCLGAVSHAEPSAAEKAAAENLFQEGRKLSREGKHAEACSKYEESNRVEASLGTQLYLADCFEKVGKLASAWALFKEAGPQARKAGQPDRKKMASDRADAIEPRLPRRTAALVAGGVGLVGAALGTFFALKASAQWSDAQPLCSGDRCRGQGCELAASARANGNRATLFSILGGVGLGAVAVLWFSTLEHRSLTVLGLGPGSVSLKGS